ncbi:MAG: winged helix-turn-helix domain-containing protein [Candidatus Nanohalobium sp.]
MEDTIGEVAGEVYEYLDDNGQASVSGVTKAVDYPGTKVYMAMGWLAREGNLEFIDKKRGNAVRLR